MTEPQKSFDELKEQSRSGLIAEFMYFLGQNKKWWLLPILIVIGMVGILVLLAGTGPRRLSTPCSERSGQSRDGIVDFRLSRIVVYPIKSLDGVTLEATQVLPTSALANDRRFAIRSAQGDWISGKTNPGVHPLRATFDQDAGRVRLLSELDGRQGEFSLTGPLEPLNAWLSDYFEEPVMVVENRQAGFPDDTDSPGPTILAQQTFDEVHNWFPTLTVDELRRRFRANLEFAGGRPILRGSPGGRRTPRRALFDQRCDLRRGHGLPALHRPYARLAYGGAVSALRPPVCRAPPGDTATVDRYRAFRSLLSSDGKYASQPAQRWRRNPPRRRSKNPRRRGGVNWIRDRATNSPLDRSGLDNAHVRRGRYDSF